MSDENSGKGKGKGKGMGCVIAIVVGLILVLALIVGAGVAGYFYWMQRPTTEGPSGTGPARPGDTKLEVTVQLTGTGLGGTRYTVEGDICEGDAALNELMEELADDARTDGRELVVKLEVAPDAGITDKALEAAREICRKAGARLAAPEAEKP